MAHAAPVLQQLQQVVAELDPDKRVDDGVEAAPEEGQALRDVGGVQQIFFVAAAVGSSLCRDERTPKENQVVRNLAEEENGDHGQDDLDGLVALKVLSLTEGLDDAAVAEAHDQERGGKGQNDLTDLDDDAQLVVVAGVRRARVVVDSGVLHFWHREDQRHHPDHGRRHLAEEHGLRAVAVRRGGLGDGKVAVHADAAQKKHAAVKADLVDRVHGLAHAQAQHPRRHGVGRPKGQRENKEQVGEGQVEQVHVRHGLESLEIEEGENDQQVPSQPQDADDGVEGGHEPAAELAVVFFIAGNRKAVVIHTDGIVVIMDGLHGSGPIEVRRAGL